MRKVLLLFVPFSVSLAQELYLEGIEVRAKRETILPQEISESSAKDPGEMLANTEGIWKLRKGGIANDIVVRGFGGRNISVLFDGARLWGACPNRMDPPLFHIDLSEVRKIEVVKGPFDVRHYGGLGGTVNMITTKPKRGFHGKLSLGAGSFSYFNPSLSISYGGKRFYGLFGYSYRYSKPYKTGEDRRFTEYANYKTEELDSTAFGTNTIWTRLGFKPSKDSEIKLSYTAQRVRDVLYPYLMMDSPQDDADRLSFRIEYRRLRLNAYYSYVYHLMNNSKRSAMMSMETVARSKTYGLRAEYDMGALDVGLDALSWNWSATTTMGNMPAQNTIPGVNTRGIGVYGELKKNLSENLRLVAGLRLDSVETGADKAKANTELYYRYHGTRNTSKRDTYPSGNIQLFYKFSEGIELFGGLGYSVRVPDAQERYFALDRMGTMEKRYGDWVGNPDLKLSRNLEMDLGLDLQGERISAKLTAYYSAVKDFVVLYNDTTVFGTPVGKDSDDRARSYTNVDASLFGGEFTSTVSLTDSLFLEGGISYVRGKKSTDSSKDINDEDIAQIPPLKGRISLRYDTGTYFAQIETVAQATQSMVDSDLKEEKTPGWAVVNVKAGGSIRRFRITAGIDNLFNKFYYEHLSYLRDPFSRGSKIPEPGRSLYLNVAYTF